jgi:hypothetical protein
MGYILTSKFFICNTRAYMYMPQEMEAAMVAEMQGPEAVSHRMASGLLIVVPIATN